VDSINIFFLSGLKEWALGQPIAKRFPGWGGHTNANGHSIGPGVLLGHGAAIFLMLMSRELIFTIYSYVNNQLDGLFFVITIFCSKVREYFLLKL
jgi:hypothetical protein